MANSKEATERKLRELQDRQARWMEERKLHMDRSTVEAEMQRDAQMMGGGGARAGGPPRPATSAGADPGASSPSRLQPPQQTHSPQRGRACAGPPSALPESHYFKPEEIVTRLTERITDRLRDELRTELQNETSRAAAAQERETGKLEGFLASEIESHTCPICYELMVPPLRPPILLFPCGHSFCQKCISAHTGTHGKSTCPFCRKQISSQAPNMALQQLIQNFVSKKDKIRASAPSLHDELPGVRPKDASPDASAATAATDDDDRARWKREEQMLDMRCRVLQNELVDVIQERQQAGSNLESANVVLQMFQQEKEKAQAKLEAAQKAMQLVEEQVQEQERKYDTFQQDFQDAEAKIDLIQRTLEPLEEEKEKLRLLLSHT